MTFQVIKMNKDIFAGFIAKDFNNCFDKGLLPDDLKHADVTPIHKKKGKSDKTNYRPVSILPNISKIYEKLIYNQLYDYFDDILSWFSQVVQYAALPTSHVRKI